MNSNFAEQFDSPFPLFTLWFEEAKSSPQVGDPTAMCLSTLTPSGYPDGRMVLLKKHDENGFVFFSNRQSNKGVSLAKTPRAALTFYWVELGKQIRIQGDVEQVSEPDSDQYFSTRDRLSRIGAWASEQSQRLEKRSVLEERVKSFEEKFAGQEVPRPGHWGGYRVKPKQIEFWQQGNHRLHDRFCFELQADGSWLRSRLNP